MRITADNIKENLKVGDFVKVNDSGYSKVTYVYWSDFNSDLGFQVKDRIFEGIVVANLDVCNDEVYIEKFPT